MRLPPEAEITLLLESLREGDSEASREVFELAYGELRLLAAARGNGSGRALQPTVLVHEAWLKCHDRLDGVRDRQHFLAVAALAMRQVVCNEARDARAQKRDAGTCEVSWDPADRTRVHPLDLTALAGALAKLAELNARHARVVELRFFGGLTIPEAAAELGVSHSTVEADWAMARAWLRRELERG